VPPSLLCTSNLHLCFCHCKVTQQLIISGHLWQVAIDLEQSQYLLNIHCVWVTDIISCDTAHAKVNEVGGVIATGQFKELRPNSAKSQIEVSWDFTCQTPRAAHHGQPPLKVSLWESRHSPSSFRIILVYFAPHCYPSILSLKGFF
jgi:hypothetical protein